MSYKATSIKKQFIVLIVFFFTTVLLTAQEKTFTKKWSASPFDNNLFIENKGQFDGELPNNNKILFKAQLGKIAVYFTPKGIVYSYSETPPAESDNKKTAEKEEEIRREKPVIHYLYASWMGTEQTSVVSADEKQSYFYAYPSGKNNTIKADVYKKITYLNLYQGIDAVYIFPEKKTGIKYSLIVHPGADISKVKLEYTGAKSIRTDSAGNIVISSELGIITDHAPISYYQANAAALPSKYQITGTVESFYLNQRYDKSRTLVIDPWTSSTSFAGINAAFDLDYDKYGNVYAYGGDVSTSTTQLVKFNSLGVKQWVFNASTMSGNNSDCYGDIATDKNSGTTYVLQGFNQGIIYKVSSSGSLSNTYPGSGIVNEYWRADYDQCHNMIIIGAGGTTHPYQAATLDTNFKTFTPVNMAATNEVCHDISLMTLDPYSNSCFMASAGHYTDTIFANTLCKLPLPSLSPITFRKKDGFSFMEVMSIPYTGYYGGGNENTNAMNGAAASPGWLYLYNGDTLKRFNKTTGILSTQIAMANTPYKWGGLDADACDNIYAGYKNTIRVYNSGLGLQSTIPLSDTVYDVHLGPKNTLFACGKGFVSAISITGTKAITTTITYPTTCSACDGTATANPACGNGTYTYLWSNGATGQTATGLCAGIYTVTVTGSGSCSPIIDTAIVNIPGKPGYTSSVIDTNATCTTTGSITAYPVGGTSPYTYNWSNGETTQYNNGLIPGIYTCIITDSNGCKYTVSTSLPPLVLPYLYITPPSDSVCIGTAVSLSLSVSGANSYTWLPSKGLSCTNCPNPVASPTANTIYTVTGINSSGCVGKDSVIVAFSPPPVLSIISYPEGCTGTYLEGFGASSYVWRPFNGVFCSTCEYTVANSYITTTYTLVGTLHGCTDSTTITLTPNSTPTVKLIASKDTLCPGDSVKLTALVSGPGATNYYWSPYTGNCKTCSSIYVKPTTTTYYTVDVVDSAGCSTSASITIYVAGITVSSYSNCIQTNLSAYGSSSGYTWYPSTGLSCTNCQYTTATPSVTTTYTVHGTGGSFCAGANTAVIIVQVIVPPSVSVYASTHSICAGDSVKLTAMASGLNIKYSWYPSTGTCNTCSVIYVKPTATTKYSVEVYDSAGGCYALDTITISVGGIGIEAASSSCGGSIYLFATGSSGTYTWSPATGLSCTNCQYTIATPTVTTIYTVTGTGGGSCGNSATFKVVPGKSSSFVSIKATPDTICAGGSVSLSASGKGITTCYWTSNSGGLSCSNCQNTKAYPGGTSVYSLTVQDSAGCSFDTSITIYVTPSVTVLSNTDFCYGPVDLHASGSISYIWSPPTGLSCTSCVNPFATPTVNTTYTVTGIGSNCPNGTTASIFVPARPSPSTSCCNATIPIGQSVSLSATGGGTYLWTPSAGLDCDTCANPVASPYVTTIYTVTVTSDSGCASATTITVDITCGTVFVPEAFSPNGDGQNDILYVRGDCIKSLDFIVFDRWGNKVFETKDKTTGWNGACKGEAMNTGSYVYYVSATMYDGTTIEKKGNVVLVR